MDENKVKEIFQQELESLKGSLGEFVKPEDMHKEIEGLKSEIQENNIKGLDDKLGELEKAAEKQGEILTELKNRGPAQKQTFKDLLKQNTDKLNQLADAGIDEAMRNKLNLTTSAKAVTAASMVDDTMAFRDPEIGKIQRGQEWVRNLFNVVTLGRNTHGSVRWYEQNSITDNTEMVAEANAPSSASDQDWIEKTLSGKRIKAFTKISRDQLKDVDFVESEVRDIVMKSLRLQENSQLYKGDGTGNNIEGIYTKAPTFTASNYSGEIVGANLFDLANLAKTEIRTKSKDGFFPNSTILYPEDVDLIRLAKGTDNRYLFPEWAMNGMNVIAGTNLVENSLVDANTLLMGDFNYGTVYLWDGLMVEMGYEGSDFKDGYITILVYERLNLRVKGTDTNAFIKSEDIAADITTMKP